MTVEGDLTGVRNEDARKAVEQGRLARATRAHHGEDLAALHGQVGTAKRRRLAEGEHEVARLDDHTADLDRGGTVRAAHDATSSASAASRAAVRSIQRRSASKWKSPWSARSASTRLPCSLRSVSSRIRRRCAPRWARGNSPRADRRAVRALGGASVPPREGGGEERGVPPGGGGRVGGAGRGGPAPQTHA